MHNTSALKLSRAGCESVNQHTRLSAEDCGTEVLTLQRQSTGGVCVCVGGGVWGGVERRGGPNCIERLRNEGTAEQQLKNNLKKKELGERKENI